VSDLEARRMLAEFAGWTDFLPPNEEDATLYAERRDGEWAPCPQLVPFYESAASAACSLLPKLAKRVLDEAPGMMAGFFRWREFWMALHDGGNAFRDTKAVCRIIADAVRKLKRGGRSHE